MTMLSEELEDTHCFILNTAEEMTVDEAVESLDLSGLDWYAKPQKCIDAFVAGDAEAFADGLTRNEALYVVADNMYALMDRGIYEDVLLSAYSGLKDNTADWSSDDIQFLFFEGNWHRHVDAIPELRDGGTVTLYRGVAGEGDARREPGMSWTTNLDLACSFAVKFGHLPNPQVLIADGSRDNIFARYDERGENEYLAWITDYAPLNISVEDMQAGNKRRCDEVKEHDRKILES